jgi:hypothetical protein
VFQRVVGPAELVSEAVEVSSGPAGADHCEGGWQNTR